MALTDNKIVRIKESPVRESLKLLSGAITIYKGALLNYSAATAGYLKLGADALSEKFVGIAMESKTLAAADNGTNGLNSILVLTRGCNEWVQLDVTSTITIANEGDKVYVDGDDKVDLAAGTVNTTNGLVGIIRQFINANQAWVQLTGGPTE